MSRPRCKAVFPRVTDNRNVTNNSSFRFGKPNDGSTGASLLPLFYGSDAERQNKRSAHYTLLPGSNHRAYANWQKIQLRLQDCAKPSTHCCFFGAIARGLSLEPLRQILVRPVSKISSEVKTSPLTD